MRSLVLRRNRRRRRGVVLAAVGPLLLLTACSGTIAVVEPTPEGSVRAVCAAVLAALPDQVLDSTRRPTDPGLLTAAWGDPALTLRCGVTAPPGLTPTSECLEVDGVGWFVEEAEGGQLFTTIGRVAFVEVGVPSQYAPEVNALLDLAAAVDAYDPVQQPCA